MLSVIILSVIVLRVIMLSVILQSVIMMCVIMLCVVMLNVVAPFSEPGKWGNFVAKKDPTNEETFVIFCTFFRLAETKTRTTKKGENFSIGISAAK